MAYITKKSDKGGSKAKEEYIAKKNIYTKPEYITKKKPEYITKKKPEYITKKTKKLKVAVLDLHIVEDLQVVGLASV